MNSAVVAYTDPQGVFDKHQQLVEQHLRHLTNLHWRPATAATAATASSDPAGQGLLVGADTTVRTIPSLKLQLVPEGTQRQKQHQIPGVNNAPFVQILIIETASLEIYRSKLRQIGKEWFQKRVEVREPTGYVVVHAISSNDSAKSTKAIWSRLTAEFDPANCVQVSASNHNSWAELRSLLQEQLVAAFDARVDMLEAEIRKLHNTRDIPGWNFGTMFAVHESLAWAYESMGLLDDALKVYNTLEVMVDEISNEVWASKVKTATLSLSSDRDVLIDPMISQTASYFDVQRHLLARKVSLMLALAQSRRQKEEMVESLADQYVLDCIRMVLTKLPVLLEELVKYLGEKIAYLWLLKTIRELFTLTTEIGSSRLAQGKGALILVERDAVQKLGTLCGWTIPGIFNEISLESTENDSKEKEDASSKEELEESDFKGVFAIENEDDYRAEFLRLTQQAIDYHRVANLPRAVTRLTAQVVLTQYHQGNVEKAWEVLKHTPSLLNMSPQQQPIVTILEVAMCCAEKLELNDKVNEFAWKIVNLGQIVPRELFKKAIDLVQKYDLPSPEVTHDLHLWFELNITPYLQGDENGYYIVLELTPKQQDYPFVPLENAELVASAPTEDVFSKDEVIFSTSSVAISEPIKLYTNSFQERVIELKCLCLRYKSHQFLHEFSDTFVAMNPLSEAFTADVVLARYHTMTKRNIELKLNSPQEIAKAKVYIQPIDEQLELLWDDVEGADSLTSFTSTVVKIPVLVDHEHSKAKIKVMIEYGDDKSFEFVKLLDFSLAVSVDFQEYFRQQPRILSQFFVKPFSSIPTIFTSAELSSSRHYEKDDSASYENAKEYVAYNNAPVSYVFGIKKREQADPEESVSMQLTLTYRSMLWECERIFYKACLGALTARRLQAYSPVVSRVIEHLSPHMNMIQYVSSGIVGLNDISSISRVVDTVFQYMNPQHAAEVTRVLTTLVESGIRKDESQKFDELNATMVLDVPDPDAEIVHYVYLALQDSSSESTRHATEKQKEYVVGEVIPAVLELETVSFQDNDISTHQFEYELDRSSEGWSFTGKVKGLFYGTTKIRENINLIPTRSGELMVPNVIIRSVTDKDVTISDSESARSESVMDPEADLDDAVVVAKHANTRVLVVPDINMLAITF